MTCIDCNVTIDSSLNKCPLCGRNISNNTIKEKNRIYPSYKDFSFKYLKYNVFLAFCLIISFNAIILDSLIFKNKIISLFITGFSCYAWYFVNYTINSKSFIAERIFYNFLVLSIILFLFDNTLGNIGWAFNYTIPIIITLIVFVFNLIVFSYKFTCIDYYIYHIIFSVICLSSFIFHLFSKIHFTWAWQMAGYFSLSSLIVISILYYNKIKSELLKRLHI
ncbi:MAG: DUF6320 domain-containing protein [Peptostreptococcaceae bacterium]